MGEQVRQSNGCQMKSLLLPVVLWACFLMPACSGGSSGITDGGLDAGSDGGGDLGADQGGDAGADPGGDSDADADPGDPGGDPGADPGGDPGAGDAGDGTPPIAHDYDVVVVGAGTGGIGAAIQAARLGVRVALVEETDWVGGQATAAGVSTMDGPQHWGLYQEFLDRVRAHYAALGKSIATCYWGTQSECFEPSVGRQIMAQMLADEANVDVYYRMRPVSAARQTVGGHPMVVALTTEHRPDGAAHEFSASVFVDATEYGDLLPLAGARYRVGNGTSDAIDPAACVQDITYTAIIRKYPGAVPSGFAFAGPPPGYDSSVASIFAAVITPTGVEWIDGSGHWTGYAQEYPVGWRTFVLYRGVPDSAGGGSYDIGTPDAFTRTGVNWPNDYDYTVAALEDPQVRQAVNCEAKLKTLQFIYYMQDVLGKTAWSMANDEGYDTAYNTEENDCPSIPAELKNLERQMPVIPYVRESRRVVGLHTLVGGEIRRESLPGGNRSATNFPTALAVGIYPVDLHDCRSSASLETGLETWGDVAPSPTKGPFQIPFESFIPEDLDGLLPAEKNLSVSRLVNGAIRLQPITMLTGQAVGTLAALSVLRGVQPRSVPPIRVQDTLVGVGVRLSRLEFSDVPTSHPRWAAVQIAATREIMIGNGADTFSVDAILTRGEAAVVLARLLALDTTHPPATATFADVPSSHPYFAAIEAIYAAGITAGCGGTPPSFCPDDPETRAQAATMLVRGLGLNPAAAPTTPLFTDVPNSNWAFAYVQLAASEGLMTGCSPGLFCPTDSITRGDTAESVRQTLLYLAP